MSRKWTPLLSSRGCVSRQGGIGSTMSAGVSLPGRRPRARNRGVSPMPPWATAPSKRLTLARGHEIAQATDPTRIKHGSWERSGARLPPGGGGRLETACGTLGTVRQRAELWRQRAETARGTAETACGTLCEVRNNAPFGVDTAAHTELNTYHCSSYCSKLQ